MVNFGQKRNATCKSGTLFPTLLSFLPLFPESVRTFVRAYAEVITKFSGIDSCRFSITYHDSYGSQLRERTLRYQDLNDEQEKVVHEILTRRIPMYTKYHKVVLFFLNEEFLVTFSLFSDNITGYRSQGLSVEQKKIFREILTELMQIYTRYRKVSTADGVSDLLKFLTKACNLTLMSVQVG